MVVMLVTFGFAFKAGSSTVSQTLPGRKVDPITAFTSPLAPTAKFLDAFCQAVTTDGLLASQAGRVIPRVCIICSKVVPPHPLAILHATSTPPIPLVFPDQKTASSAPVANAFAVVFAPLLGLPGG